MLGLGIKTTSLDHRVQFAHIGRGGDGDQVHVQGSRFAELGAHHTAKADPWNQSTVLTLRLFGPSIPS